MASATSTQQQASSAGVRRFHFPVLSERALWAAILLLCLSVTAASYGQALTFAFTFDDPLDLPRGEERTIWSLFTSSEGYTYYRPIPFVIWKVLRNLQGNYSPATLHGLTLLCHATAGWLLALLLRRLTGSYWGVIAALLFLTYPFSYQAVFGAHTLFHPLMTALLLLALLLYYDARQLHLQAQRGGTSFLLGSSLLATLIALWTHETGVVIFPLVCGLELLISARHPQASLKTPTFTLLSRLTHAVRHHWWPLLYGAAAGLFLVVWLAVPKVARPEGWSAASLLPNAQFFLQGATWPVTAQLKALGEHTGIDPVQALWPAIISTIIALIVLAGLGRQRLMPVMALAAILVILVPAWLLLTWAYLEDAPRLLYPAAPAIATLWGLLPALHFPRRALTWGWRAISLSLLAIVVIQNLVFLDLRRDMWHEGTKLVYAVADTAAAHNDRSLLFLNVPAWFAPKRPEYPVGHVGLTAMPGYVGLERVVYLHRQRQATVYSRGFYPDVNGWKYDFNAHGGPASIDDFALLLRQVDAIFVIEMLPQTGATVRLVGSLTPNVPVAAAHGPHFSDGLWLTQSTLSTADDKLLLDLTWSVTAPPPGDYLPIVRIRNTAGTIIAEQRQYPLADTAAPRLWQIADQVRDLPALRLPAGLPAGTYTVWLSWEEKFTKAALPGFALDGTPLANNDLQLGQFTHP